MVAEYCLGMYCAFVLLMPLALLLFLHPDLAREHRDDLDIDDFTHPASQALWQHLGSTRWPDSARGCYSS